MYHETDLDIESKASMFVGSNSNCDGSGLCLSGTLVVEKGQTQFPGQRAVAGTIGQRLCFMSTILLLSIMAIIVVARSGAA